LKIIEKHNMRQQQRIKQLEKELASVKSDLWNLVGGGEFSAWVEATNPTMPIAAYKEYAEAKRHFPDLKENYG